MPTKSRSSTAIDLLPNPHPGEILQEEFLKPMGLSQTALARAIGVPPRRINEIVLGKRIVTADTDLRLARYFGFVGRVLHGPPGRLRTDGPPSPDCRPAQSDHAKGSVSQVSGFQVSGRQCVVSQTLQADPARPG
jgi:addiction module HigA family antidote